MAALTGSTIDDTYKDLLQVSNSNSGIDATLRTISDGEGTDSAVKISTGALQVDNLVLNGNDISADNSNGSITLSPNGTGVVSITGTASSAAEIRLAEDTDNGTNYLGFKAPSAVTTSTTFTLPNGDGSNNQVLTTNGSGTLSWSTAGGLSDVSGDTSPSLGGNLDVETYSLITTANRDVIIAPNGTGNLALTTCSIEIATGEAILDAGGDELLKFVEGTTPVNFVQITSANTGADVTIEAAGDDTNVGLNLTAKGSGTVDISGAALTIGYGATGPGEVRLLEDSDNGSNYIAIKSPSAVTSNVTFVLPGTDGTANQVLSTDGSATLTWATIGATASSKAQMEAATDTTTFVSPGRVQNFPGAMKAHIKANFAGSNLQSYNVSSITDGGTGLVQVDFSTAFADVQYASVATVQHTSALIAAVDQNYSITTSSSRLKVYDIAGSAADGTAVGAAFFGDQ